MSQRDQVQVQAGWFPDPQGGPRMRYWDGSAWTAHTSPTVGVRSAERRAPVIATIALVLASLAWLLGFVSSNAVPAIGFLLILSTVAALALGVVGMVRSQRDGRGFTGSVVATVMAGLIVVSGLSVVVRG